jgi:signal transduction histidine kinase
MNDDTKRHTKGRSLRTTYLLLAALIAILLVSGAIAANFYIEILNSRNAESLQLRNAATDIIDKLRHHVWRVETRLNTIFTPHATDDQKSMLRDLDLAIQELHKLDALKPEGTASLTNTITLLNDDLLILQSKVLELIELSQDPNWVFPILPYLSDTLLASNQAFSAAISTALDEIGNEKPNTHTMEMYRGVTQLRDLWRRQILDFRAVVIRIIGLNQTENLPQEKNLELRQEVILEKIDSIENLYQQDPFGFDTGDALKTMRYRAKKWFADYKSFEKITASNILRTDVHYIKTEIQPVQRQVAKYLTELERIVQQWSTENIYNVESAANKIIIEIWLLTIISLLFLGLAYNIISRTLLRPISQLSDDLRKDSHTNSTHSLSIKGKGLAINSQEINSLIDSYNNMKQIISARDKELMKINQELENQVKLRTIELENRNNELKTFNYSVSHDLRSPLRSIDGFSLALLEDCEDQLNDVGKDYLKRIRNNSQRMGELIDDMLQLSAVSHSEIRTELVNLSDLAQTVFAALKEQQPDRQVEMSVENGITTKGDKKLLQIVLENLIGNAWKYSKKQQIAKIEFGEFLKGNKRIFFIKDNGAGFNMEYKNKLFGVFQRLHNSEYEGTGIGLATVKRIIDRHGGNIWANAKENIGATFYFTLK